MPLDRIEVLLRRLEERLNRPLWRPDVDRSLDLWQAGPLLERLRALQPTLLVSVTTYRRPGPVVALVDALRDALATSARSCFVVVLNDRSDVDCSAARSHLQACFGERAMWLDAREHVGKRRFWRTHQVVFSAAEAARSDHLLSLQDDVELAPQFLQRLWRAWDDTAGDPQRHVLNLYSGVDDEEHGRWVRFTRRAVPDAAVRRTDWFDLAAFMIDRPGLELLRYWIVPIPDRRWRKDPTLSTGVGRQLTRRLFGRAATYQCDPPLVSHGASDSVMNPEARARRPLDNRSLLPAAPPPA